MHARAHVNGGRGPHETPETPDTPDTPAVDVGS